jgi:Amt family ammonium transporter
MTLADVRTKTDRIREYSAIPFLLVAAVSLAGALFRPAAQAVTGGPVNAGDTAWMLTATGLVLLMTPGLSFFYGGMVRTKNVVSTMLQSFVAMGVISLLWIVVRFSLAFGTSFHGLIGDPAPISCSRVGADAPRPRADDPADRVRAFQLKFAIITPALITGSSRERVRSPAISFMCLFSIFVYSPLAHWTWAPEGFLHKMGVLDFAGGTVVHMSAGFAALAGAMVLGRRTTHKNREATTPANIPFVILGTGMLWFGWFGFNAGSALPRRARARWPSRRRTPRRRQRRWRGFSSTGCAARSRRRWARASARWSGSSRSRRPRAMSASARRSSSARSRAWSRT